MPWGMSLHLFILELPVQPFGKGGKVGEFSTAGGFVSRHFDQVASNVKGRVDLQRDVCVSE